ncbi:hypothetical protein cypCar_00041651, partial [Cyprinus carpio]
MKLRLAYTVQPHVESLITYRDKKPDMDRELDKMEQDLEDLVNLTRGAQDKVVYLKDSETQAQKQEQ